MGRSENFRKLIHFGGDGVPNWNVCHYWSGKGKACQSNPTSFVETSLLILNGETVHNSHDGKGLLVQTEGQHLGLCSYEH